MANAPYGVRLLVGAAATVIEETRKLPQTILMYPMTLASQAAHLVMRWQQNVADLVIKGDETLETLFPPKDEQPEWATFDEDLEEVPEVTSLSSERDRRTEGRFALYSADPPEPAGSTTNSQRGDVGGRGAARHRRRARLRLAHAGPAAGPAAIAECRRTRRAAGLRGRHQGARAVSDPAGQQDHPRDREVTTPAPPNSAENPWPVRAVATRVAKWIDRLGTVWVEGQLTEMNARPDSKTVFMVLRDPAADMSLTVTCPRDLVLNAPVRLAEGTQVVVCGKPSFYTGRGSFSLRLTEIRAVGIGELLARIERLRRLLDAEGLFDVRLKRPHPVPANDRRPDHRARQRRRARRHDRRGRALARRAFRDAQHRGPGTERGAADRRRAARARRTSDVDVIVVARGGGSVEDLLPFSDETLCRAIAACTTPVVSAVGHEPDNPLCDLVADVRAATPTDAAKRIVPDMAAERALLADLRRRGARALRDWVSREERLVQQLRSRPVLAAPLQMLSARSEEIHRARTAARRDIDRLVTAETDRVGHLSARLATLGPAATLARGYAVVQAVRESAPAVVLRSVDDAPAGRQLRVRVSDGAFGAVSSGEDPS